MRTLYVIFLLLFIFPSWAQERQKLEVQKTIETFFDAFHNQDSLLIISTISPKVNMRTIGTNKESGNIELREVDFKAFLSSILSIPDTVNFQEKLLSFNIQIDGKMAHAWTPYEFWYKDQFSHCGVNSFQLVREEENWRIVSIMDTRRKQDCY